MRPRDRAIWASCQSPSFRAPPTGSPTEHIAGSGTHRSWCHRVNKLSKREEVSDNPLPAGYPEYLRHKLRGRITSRPQFLDCRSDWTRCFRPSNIDFNEGYSPCDGSLKLRHLKAR